MENPRTRRRRVLKRAIGDRAYWWLRFAYRLPIYRRMEESAQLRARRKLPVNAIPLDDELCIHSPDHLLCHHIFTDMAIQSYTRAELDGFLRLAEGCTHLLDLGASAGYFSSVFAQVCPVPGKVVSVEPEAKSFDLLQESRRLNSKDGVEWLIFNCGVAETDRPVKFSPASQLGTTVDEDNPDGVDIDCMMISSICRKAAVTPDLIKLDIESYEYEVLMSSLDFLRDVRPRLHLELHSPQLRERGLDPGDLLRRLDALGYRAHGEPRGRRTNLTMLLCEYETQRFDLHMTEWRERQAPLKRAGLPKVESWEGERRMAGECVLCVLTSLAAEGTPRLVLELCRIWQRDGIRPVVVLLRAQPDDLAPDFEALGIERVCLHIGDRGYLRYLRLTIESFKLSRRIRPEAVLSMPLGWHAFIAWGAKLAGVPRVAAHVGTYPWHWKGLPFRKFQLEVQLGKPVTDCLICCSEYVQGGVLRWFAVAESKTSVVYNGIEGKRFSSSSKHVKEKPSWTAGMLGRIDHTKDYTTLILACLELKERRRPIELRLIGDGSGRGELESLVARCGLGDQVHFLGVRRDVPEVLAQLDAFLFAAKREEGLGIALIEAMAAGVPVIATDVGACREVLDDGALGLLVPPRDPLALADAIEHVRDQPETAARRAERARRKAFEVFDAERMAAAYAELLGLTTDRAAPALEAA